MKTSFNIRSIFQMSYPAMCVYEFYGYMQQEQAVAYWDNSTIYFICQRPVIYYDDLILEDGMLAATIKQRGNSKTVRLKLPLGKGSELNPDGDDLKIDIQFFTEDHYLQQPFNNVAGFQFIDVNGNFLGWFTPERLIYDHIIRTLYVEFEGDFHQFLEYHVHYIGQAQDQKIWKRLKNHETLQKILATEHPYITGEYSSHEFVLIFLQLTGADKFNKIQPEISDFVGEELRKEVVHQLDKIQDENTIDLFRKQFTNDIEAYLINHFEPPQNKILFKDYPNITNGLKSIGAEKIIHDFLVIGNLKTEEGSYFIKTNPIYMKKK